MRAWLGLMVWLTASISWAADRVLVEAESFQQHGGWVLDTQFIQQMGSPYLLAHGIGRAVKDATTEVEFPSVGKYRVFVRTKDWVARWDAKGQPGRFQVLVNGQALKTTFGTEGKEWQWQDGGSVEITNLKTTLALHDLTGFDGRCDAILFTQDDGVPPNDAEVLASWRRKLLNLPEKAIEQANYDLVVVGGGYAGMGAAISAARMGCKVALIQDRPVLGGNGSSEVRVWAMGLIRRGEYPRIGEIVEEFSDRASKSPGREEEFEDAKKEAIVRAEKNIDLFLNHHAHRVEMRDKRVVAVHAFDTRTSVQRRFTGKLFCDCTGHGTIGALAEAEWDMTEKGRMGMSNMWRWEQTQAPVEFPETSWALDMKMADFPYPREGHGEWFWESGYDKDPLKDAEGIRDWNLRAVYGAFNAMKNRDGKEKHTNAALTWVAFIGGPRESRRLMGDVLLTQEDIVTKKKFEDGCVPSTWSIDLHYPKQQFAKKFPDNPFISIAEHDQRIDRTFGYPIPYRCFYSKNISNLFMAGRNISVTHEALGTVRVMKTCGMMGEVVGKAASICALQSCEPRDVYARYWKDMQKLLELPGQARRETVSSEIVLPKNAPVARKDGPPTGLDPATLGGVVVDDRDAEKVGSWTEGTGLKGYVGHGYVYAGGNSNASIRFKLKAPKAGTYDLRIAYQPHENRGRNVLVAWSTTAGEKQTRVDMTKATPLANGFLSLGKVELAEGEECVVIFSTKDAGGNVHADAVMLAK